jgi:hypothetical protein
MSGRYARVYHDLMDDPKFEAVYPDDHRFALWVRLLMAADASYPSPPTIPRRVNGSALAHLVGVGLIDLVPGDRYKVHGLARERADGARIGREGGLERARTAPREQGRFVRETPANAGDAGPAHAGPAHQPRNATQLNTSSTATLAPTPGQRWHHDGDEPRKNGADRTTCPDCGDLLNDRDPDVIVSDHGRQLWHRACVDGVPVDATTEATP